MPNTLFRVGVALYVLLQRPARCVVRDFPNGQLPARPIAAKNFGRSRWSAGKAEQDLDGLKYNRRQGSSSTWRPF
jgi:hypothetical protein